MLHLISPGNNKVPFCKVAVKSAEKKSQTGTVTKTFRVKCGNICALTLTVFRAGM
jgi:hypothetical protein